MSLEDKIVLLISAIEKLNESINKLELHRPANALPNDKLIPLTKWGDSHEWPTIAALRNIVFNKRYNGAESFIVKLGRRVYIDERKFFEWVKTSPSLGFKSNSS